MSDVQVAEFVARYPDAAMITMRADGAAHIARIELAVLDGRSGRPDRREWYGRRTSAMRCRAGGTTGRQGSPTAPDGPGGTR
jgi:hypothetical protein